MNSIPTLNTFLQQYQRYLCSTLVSYDLQEQDPTLVFFKASLIYRRMLEITQIFEAKANNLHIEIESLHQNLQLAVSQLITKVNIAIHLRLNSFKDMKTLSSSVSDKIDLVAPSSKITRPWI